MPVLKATPMANLLGVRDESSRPAVNEPIPIPSHLPQMFIMAPRGNELPQLVSGSSAQLFYGADAFDSTKKYYNHQNHLAKTFLSAGNSILATRIKLAGASTAFLRITAEVIRATIPKMILDVNGATIQESIAGVPQTVAGFRVVYHSGITNYLVGQQVFGGAQVNSVGRVGATLVADANADGVMDTPLSDIAEAVSTYFPIMDAQVSSFGSFGDNVGLVISSHGPQAVSPVDNDWATEEKAFLYRFSAVERANAMSTGTLLNANSGETSMDLTLVSGKVNKFGDSMSLDEAFVPAYQTDIPGTTPVLGPFGAIKLYDASISAMQTMLAEGVDAVGAVPAGVGEYTYDDNLAIIDGATRTPNPASYGLLNMLTGVRPDGAPHVAFDVTQSVYLGGISFNANSVVYATGGSDGMAATGNPAADKLENLKRFDAAVAAKLDAWGNPNGDAFMMDDAFYPLSAVWDSGFSLETKKKFYLPMSRRKDVITHVCTHIVADYDNFATLAGWDYQPQNTEAIEQSIAVQLQTIGQLYPESEVYGTPACRAVVFGQSGKLSNSPWKETSSLIVDFAAKIAAYMGAGDGRWKADKSPDAGANNQVSMFNTNTVNLKFKRLDDKNKSWDAGLIYAQNYDRASLFYPAFQTIYPDDTSVLNSYFTAAACARIEREVQNVWRDLSGKELTPAQFIERSNNLVSQKLDGAFHGRYVIRPNTKLTGGDLQRGFSWTCDVELYAPNARTVATFTIIARRIEDLPAAA